MTTTAVKPRLTPKQQAFVVQYIVDYNGAKAAIRAGFAERSANVTASRLLAKANIQAAIAKSQQRIANRVDVKLEDVVNEYRRIAFVDTTSAIYIKNGRAYVTDTDELTADQRAAISEIRETKDGILIKFHSKTAALDSLGKYLGMFADKNTGQNADAGGITINMIAVTNEVRHDDSPSVIDVVPTQVVDKEGD